MIDHLVSDLPTLRKADVLIGKIGLSVLVRRLGLFAFAALTGVFGLGMANIADYNALQQIDRSNLGSQRHGNGRFSRSRRSCWRLPPNPALGRRSMPPCNSAKWHLHPLKRTRAVSGPRLNRSAMR